MEDRRRILLRYPSFFDLEKTISECQPLRVVGDREQGQLRVPEERHHCPAALRIKGRGDLIQYKNSFFQQQGPGQSQSLFFSSRDYTWSVCPEYPAAAAGFPEPVVLCSSDGSPGAVGPEGEWQQQGLAHPRCTEHRFLADEGNCLSQMRQGSGGKRFAVKPELCLLWALRRRSGTSISLFFRTPTGRRKPPCLPCAMSNETCSRIRRSCVCMLMFSNRIICCQPLFL